MARTAPEGISAAFRVTTDKWLFRQIISFQRGIPVVLRQFWVYHDPMPSQGRISRDDIDQLLKLIVESGRLYHLELIRSNSRYFVNRPGREPRSNRLSRLAVAGHRVDILEWMLDKGMALAKPYALWRDALENSRTNDGLEVLELLQRIYPLGQKTARRLLPSWLFKPTAPLLQWIKSQFPSVKFPTYLTTAAAVDQNLATLRYLLEFEPYAGGNIALFRDLNNTGQVEALEFLLVNFPEDLTNEFAEQLMRDTKIPIQEMVNRHPTIFAFVVRKVFIDAVSSGDYERMQRLYSHGTIDPSDLISVDSAAMWVGLAGLRFLHEHNMASATTDAMDVAAEASRWDVVEFLHLNRSEGCTKRAVEAALDFGEIKWVCLLFENRSENDSAAAMDRVAANGSLEVLKYLHLHSNAGCTSSAMDMAASNGHKRVVEFLHKHRTEGCTTQAVDGAARGGFLDVVKYLCEHRTEGCTVAAVQSALENHHVDVVEVLYKHYPQLFGADLLSELLLRGAFDIFTELRDEFPQQAESVVEPVMFEAGKQLELRTVVFILEELGRSDLRQLALDGAVCLEGSHCAAWKQVIDTITTSSTGTLTPTNPLYWMAHPLLRDNRPPTWALEIIFSDNHVEVDVYDRCLLPFTWAIRAVHRRDFGLLRAIHNLPPGTNETSGANPFRFHFGLSPFSFQGARGAAIRAGDKMMLEWLLINVDLPVEPSLLDEAVYYHQFEIAEWLVENYPAACTELDWTNKGNEASTYAFGLRDGLLDWLESHEAVRKSLSFTGIIDFAARKNDVSSLRRLHSWYPERFTPRPSLAILTNLPGCRDSIDFLLEVGWSPEMLESDGSEQHGEGTRNEGFWFA